MAEPTVLYQGSKTVTVWSPSEAKRLQAEGWSLTPPAPEAEPEPKPKSAKK